MAIPLIADTGVSFRRFNIDGMLLECSAKRGVIALQVLWVVLMLLLGVLIVTNQATRTGQHKCAGNPDQQAGSRAAGPVHLPGPVPLDATAE